MTPSMEARLSSLEEQVKSLKYELEKEQRRMNGKWYELSKILKRKEEVERTNTRDKLRNVECDGNKHVYERNIL